MSRRLTEYEGFSVTRKYNVSGFNPFSDVMSGGGAKVSEEECKRSRDLIILVDGKKDIGDPLEDLRNSRITNRSNNYSSDARSEPFIPLFPGAQQIEREDGGFETETETASKSQTLSQMTHELFSFTQSPEVAERPEVAESQESSQMSSQMIQPRDKSGQRLLYKYPDIPMVCDKGNSYLSKKEYYLLVGQSNRSDFAWLLQFDGAANPNPGPASSGAVLWSPREADGKRRIVFEMGKFLGRATNNIAEIQGLLLGLKMAAVRGARELLIEGDSELIIFQQIRKYQVKDKNLKVWWAEIQAAMMDESSFDWIAIRQVPREFNERADSITKEVLQTKQGFSRE